MNTPIIRSAQEGKSLLCQQKQAPSILFSGGIENRFTVIAGLDMQSFRDPVLRGCAMRAGVLFTGMAESVYDFVENVPVS